MNSLDKDIARGPDELRERLWHVIRTAKYREELCNSDGDIISSWYRPVVDPGLAMLLVDKLIEAGVTFDVIATWKHRGDKNDYLWAECSMQYKRITIPNGNGYTENCANCARVSKCVSVNDCQEALKFYLGQLEDKIESGELVERGHVDERRAAD